MSAKPKHFMQRIVCTCMCGCLCGGNYNPLQIFRPKEILGNKKCLRSREKELQAHVKPGTKGFQMSSCNTV